MSVMRRSSSLGSTFDRLWAASVTSNFADGLLGTAAPLLAVSLTRDPVTIAAFGALGSAAWLLFAIPIGALADRLDRGLALAAANLVRFGLLVVLLSSVVFDFLSIPLLFVLAFITGVCEVVVDTTTQAVMPMVLEPSQFEQGNARMSIAESVVQAFIAGPIGGFLFVTAVALPFALGTVGYLAAALLVLAAALQPHRPLRPVRSEEPKHFVEDLKEGLRFLFTARQVMTLVIFTTSAYMMFNFAHATLTLFILDELLVPEAWFGAFLTVGGLGYVAGSAIATRVSAALGRGRAMAIGMVISSVTVILEGLSPNAWTYLVCNFVGSTAIAIWNILLMACYQGLIPAELFGRVHGARRTLVWGMGPIGAIFGGWVAHNGLRVPIVIGGIAILVTTLLFYRTVVRIGTETAAAAVEQTNA